MNPIIKQFEESVFQSKKKHPSFRSGDTVRVHYKIEEGTKADGQKKYRIQQLEGICTRVSSGKGAASSFTIRKQGANGVGVERVFALASPCIDRIDLVAAGMVRRARLYYLRELFGKAARIRTKRIPEGTITSTIDPDAVKEKKEKKPKAKKSAKSSKKKS